MPGKEEYVPRAEYTQFVKMYELHRQELRVEIKDMDIGLKESINKVSMQIDGMETKINAISIDGWKLVATAAVSLIGGYLLYFLQHLVFH